MTQKKLFHGGDIYSLHRQYGIPINEIIDFSGNINPLPISKELKEVIYKQFDHITHYPDVDYLELRKAIGDYVKVSPQMIMVGNGATELIFLMIKAANAKRVLIPSPTYGEYERAFRNSGAQIELYQMEENKDFILDSKDLIRHIVKTEVDFLVLCNPNNPTGRIISHEGLTEILEFCMQSNVNVMLDETYIEFVPDIEKTTMVGEVMNFSNTVIIRGFTKFFAVPGIRLGYAVCHPRWRILIENYKEAWTVNAFAEMIGRYMLHDTLFIENSRKWIQKERVFLPGELNNFAQFHVFPTEANYILVKIIDSDIRAWEVKDKLAERGLLIRDASSFHFLNEEFLRFAILDHEKNVRLLHALKDILQ